MVSDAGETSLLLPTGLPGLMQHNILIQSPLPWEKQNREAPLPWTLCNGQGMAFITGKIRKETEHVKSSCLLLTPWGQAAGGRGWPLSSCRPSSSIQAVVGKIACSLQEQCGSHWDGLPAALSPFYPLVEACSGSRRRAHSLYQRMKWSELGKVSSPPLQGIGLNMAK